MAKALTVKAIEAERGGAARREIPDGGLPGLYLVVQPSGLKSWAVRYRFGARPRKMTIGAFPAYGLSEARKAASAALRAITEGRDPGDEKAAAKAARSDERNRVESVLDEFLNRHVDVKNRASTGKETRRFIENEIKPRWRGRHIKSVTRRDVIDLLDEIVDRGAPASANRVHSILRKFFNWAIERDVVDASPCANVKAPSKDQSRDRVLTDDEIRLLWLTAESEGWPFGTFTQLLLLTGQRRSEVAGARLSEMDLKAKAARWTIPRERAKNDKPHEVALAPAAVEIIRGIPKVEGDEDLLLSTNGKTPVSGFSKAKRLIDTKMIELARKEAVERGVNDPDTIKLEPWRLHDVRRTVASGMAALGFPPHVVDAALNHKSGSIKGITRVYLRHDYADERRKALLAWAKRVTAIVGHAEARADPLRRAAT